MSEKQIKENLRRVRSGAAFVTENAGGTRTWVHDPGVQRDVLISTSSTDRGQGSKDSISMLRSEETPEVEVLLAKTNDRNTPEPWGMHRDEKGRFVCAARR